MYFFKKDGRQYVDLTGNLILSHNNAIVKVRSASAGPSKILNATYILNVGKLNIRSKFKATMMALLFIWGKPAPLLEHDTDLKKPFKKDNREPVNDND